MRATIYLARQALFAKNLKVDPSETQKILVFANIPYSFKIVYGLVVDNMHIGRSRKKYFILICNVLQFLSLICISIFPFTKNTAWIIGCLLFIMNICIAFIDMVIDTILID